VNRPVAVRQVWFAVSHTDSGRSVLVGSSATGLPVAAGLGGGTVQAVGRIPAGDPATGGRHDHRR
jgi:hypothetical protein